MHAIHRYLIIESDLRLELFSLEDGFDGLGTAPRVGETASESPISSQFIQAPGEDRTHTADESTLTENGSVGLPTSNRPLPQPISPPKPGQQPAPAAPAYPAFTFTFPSSSSTRPASRKAGRCLVCTKALCPRRHDCNGSVNRAWCMHGHPPLGANEKIRWSETEVERKIAEANGGSESTA